MSNSASLNGGGDLVLDYLRPSAVADHLGALLKGFYPPYLYAHRGIELQGPSSGGDLGIAEHYADFLPYLVYEDHA